MPGIMFSHSVVSLCHKSHARQLFPPISLCQSPRVHVLCLPCHITRLYLAHTFRPTHSTVFKERMGTVEYFNDSVVRR